MLSARLKLFQPFHKFFLDIAQKLCVILRFETEMAYQKEQIVYGYKLQAKNSIEDSYQSFHRQGVILTIAFYFLLDRFHQFLSIWEIDDCKIVIFFSISILGVSTELFINKGDNHGFPGFYHTEELLWFYFIDNIGEIVIGFQEHVEN